MSNSWNVTTPPGATERATANDGSRIGEVHEDQAANHGVHGFGQLEGLEICDFEPDLTQRTCGSRPREGDRVGRSVDAGD
jgi:hypothetical protein